MQVRLPVTSALVFGLMAFSGSIAAAESSDVPNEAAEMQMVAAAKISAAEAAQAAAAKVGGKVSSVTFTARDGRPLFRVEVVTPDGKQQDVAVDAVTGDATLITAEQGDTESENDNDGDN